MKSKFKILIILIILLIVFLIVSIIYNLQSKAFTLNTYENEVLTFIYDNNFNLTNDITLTTKDKNSVVVITYLKYSSVYKNTINQTIADSLASQVIEDTEYKEIYSELIDGKYYYLYEDISLERQIEVIVIFESNYVFTIIFEANSDEFDLYATSVDIISDSIGEV